MRAVPDMPRPRRKTASEIVGTLVGWVISLLVIAALILGLLALVAWLGRAVVGA